MLFHTQKKCTICDEEGNWKLIIRDPHWEMADGSDCIVCDDCMKKAGVSKETIETFWRKI